MIILLLLVVLFLIALDSYSVGEYVSPHGFGGFVIILGAILAISLSVGVLIPTQHLTETYKLLGIKDGDKVFYLVIQSDSTESPNTAFVIKEGNAISEKNVDGESIIKYDNTKPPQVVFHRTYVKSKSLRTWFFTREDPNWYEFIVPGPGDILNNL